MEFQAFVGGDYQSQAVTLDQERLVNYYVERAESKGSAAPSALYPTPGVTALPLTLPSLDQPAAPTVTPQGAAGASAWGYKIVAYLGDGTTHSQGSGVGQTNIGNAVLDGVNFNRITWAAITNAVYYKVYRSVPPAGVAPDPTATLLTTTTLLTYDHTGSAGTPQDPAGSSTAGIAFTPNGPGRAHFCQDGREFAVIGTIFYEIGVNALLTPRGTVAIGANPATITSNGDGGDELFITSGDNGYVYDLTANTLTQIAALNGKATMGDFLDGYFLALDANTSTFYASNLLDGTTWQTGTMFAQRSAASDPWKSMKVSTPYIWLFGEYTTEVWYDAGSASFPFAKHPSGLIQYGIAAPFSVSKGEGGALVWLSSSSIGDGSVLRANGFTPEPVSDYPREYMFDGYGTISDAVADTYRDFGHTFYLLSFPTQDITWAWDAGTQSWAERVTWIAEQNKFVAWRPRWHAMAFGEHRMLDASTGNVYRFNYAAGATDVDARPIRRIRRAPCLSYENRLITYPGFELDLEVGLGTATGQGADPQIMLRISKDGGKTFGNEIMRSAGKTGEYSRRARWDACGQARRMVFEVSMTDPIPWRLTDAYLTPDPEGIPQRRAA